MNWNVYYSKRVEKNIKKYSKSLPDLKEVVAALAIDLEFSGPELQGWPKFQKEPQYHCHLRVKKAQFQFVASWIVIDNEIQIIELDYVGSHEDAPYMKRNKRR